MFEDVQQYRWLSLWYYLYVMKCNAIYCFPLVSMSDCCIMINRWRILTARSLWDILTRTDFICEMCLYDQLSDSQQIECVRPGAVNTHKHCHYHINQVWLWAMIPSQDLMSAEGFPPVEFVQGVSRLCWSYSVPEMTLPERKRKRVCVCLTCSIQTLSKLPVLSAFHDITDIKQTSTLVFLVTQQYDNISGIKVHQK